MSKHDSDLDMRDLRDAFERRVFDWPGVTCRWMFGSYCYLGCGRLFAFLEPEAVVVTTLGDADRTRLASEFATEPFMNGRQEMHGWMRVPLEREDDLDTLLPYLRLAYEGALRKGGQLPRRKRAPSG